MHPDKGLHVLAYGVVALGCYSCELRPLVWVLYMVPTWLSKRKGMYAMGDEKQEKASTRISLAHLTFEDAVTALVRDDEPKRKGSQAGESCSTKVDGPEAGASEK